MIDLYCLGGASVDLVLEVPRLPMDGEKLLSKYFGQLPGGFIANTACAAAKLGLQAAWGGWVGDDVFGQNVMQSFEEFGVQTNDVQPQKNSPSDFTVVLIHPNGERTILVVPILPIPPPLNDAMRRSLQTTCIGYTALYDYDWFMEVADLLHDGCGKVAVDLEINTLRDLDAAKRMLKAADIVFSDEDALQKLTGQDEPNKSIKEVLSIGPELIVLTKGSAGAAAFTRTDTYTTGTYQVPIKDTTGAGDCFHAAFLFGILSDFQYQYCLDFASAASALLIQEIGARRGLPAAMDVQKFMENNFRGDEI
ncbi:MAG: carbohydrate kinase family protein [Anaerolineaceae bacterium]